MGRKKLPDSRDDMATRSSSTKTTTKKLATQSSSSHSKKNASAATKGKSIDKLKAESKAQTNAVPHVVRVTFLGVAGISANTTPSSTQQQSDNNNNSSPSLNFPLPSNLRAVASVSRTYKSGGKPSGLSNCLTKPPPPATGGSGGGSRSKNSSQDDNGRNNNNKGDGVEIVRPYTPNRMHNDDKPDEVNKSSSTVSSSAGSGGQQSERFVAVWNDDCSINDDVGTNQKLLNTSNAVAFEAELVPSSLDENEKNLPAKNNVGAFAPKNFCVTLALVPDNNDENETISNNEMPLFGIPIGFCNLTINGEETLNGRRRQLDLPLSSYKDFIGPLDRQSPLIQLTKADDNVNDVKSSETKKTKKSKSIVKRIFKKSGKKGANNGATSIFQLGRPPNAEERNLFLERFGVDQSGDAIIRIALEVFPRGSALEKTFRHAAKLRKRRQRKKAEEREAGASSSVERTDSIDLSAATSSSLVDDGSFASDYSLMSSDEGSWDDDHTGSWDDEGETYYTFDDTVMKGSSKPSNKSVFGRMFDCGICASDTDYIDEMTIDEYNIDSVASAVASMDKRAIDEYNIDTVASAMASMSMSEHGHDADNDEQSALATQNQVSNQNSEGQECTLAEHVR